MTQFSVWADDPVLHVHGYRRARLDIEGCHFMLQLQNLPSNAFVIPWMDELQPRFVGRSESGRILPKDLPHDLAPPNDLKVGIAFKYTNACRAGCQVKPTRQSFDG